VRVLSVGPCRSLASLPECTSSTDKACTCLLLSSMTVKNDTSTCGEKDEVFGMFWVW